MRLTESYGIVTYVVRKLASEGTMADKAGKSYWDQVWTDRDLPAAVNPHSRNLFTYADRCFHEYFSTVLSDLKTVRTPPAPTASVVGPASSEARIAATEVRFLEIGCARSTWLPYFIKEYGFSITGLDYSEIGCRQARQILATEGVSGTVVQADFFSPPEEMLSRFDVVVSLGVAEHFEDTAATLRAFGRFLKLGGRMITIIPNLVGSIGTLQKWINRPVYDIHVPMGTQALREAHQKAGLVVKDCRYWMSTNFAVNNLEGLEPGKLSTRLKRIFLAILTRLSLGVWALDRGGLKLPPSQLFSPYVICLSTKPEETW
jgi:2-polyprenyl-3-methyl-5-hydroxy-6-metoxy-1,4-benzoquinol methylase